MMRPKLPRVLLILTVLALPGPVGPAACAAPGEGPSSWADPLISPYQTERRWAVAPFNNESGSQHANVIRIADQVGRQFEQASYITVVPMNRVLEAMTDLEMREVASEEEAMKLIDTLGVDGLIAGTVTAFDPYDPPTLGVAVELFTTEHIERAEALNLRQLSRAATDEGAFWAQLGVDGPGSGQPVSSTSDHFDGADPYVRRALKAYASGRGSAVILRESHRPYLLSAERFSEFVAYVTARRLLQQERRRIDQWTHYAAEAIGPTDDPLQPE